jgi:hypothetical protein
MEAGISMKAPLILLIGTMALGAPLAAQLPTGEIRINVVGAYAPRVTDTTGYGEIVGPPQGSALAGVSADLSFIVGRFRLGPETLILRGPSRRVWSLGGVARYEFGSASIRPYAVGGVAAYFWSREILFDFPGEPGSPYLQWQSDVNYFTMNAGVGIVVGSPGKRAALTSEFRAHRSFQNGGGAGVRSLLSLGVGARIVW